MIQEVGDYTVYKHASPNGKVYIGITKVKPSKRWRNGKGYENNAYFWKAINKYGWENFEHEVLFSSLTKEDACNLEKKLIAEYRSNDPRYGYNLTSGGEQGAVRTPEARQHMSNAMRGIPKSEEHKKAMRLNHYDCSGKNNPNYGKKWTPEQLAVRQAHRIYKSGGGNPCAKPIIQYTLDGQFVKRWGSISEASREYCRVGIRNCLNGKYKQHKGFVWRYENEQRERTQR